MPRRREAWPLAEHYGDLVRVALMEARPAGLHTYQLMSATRLTNSQVGRGIRHVRDVVAAEQLTPVTWTRKEGYMFSEEPAKQDELRLMQHSAECRQGRFVWPRRLGRLTAMAAPACRPAA